MVTLVEWTAILSALASISAVVFLVIELRRMDEHKDLEMSMKLFEWAETDRLRKALGKLKPWIIAIRKERNDRTFGEYFEKLYKKHWLT